MKKLIVGLLAILVLYSCNTDNKVIDLLEDSSRWDGGDELLIGEEGMNIEGENNTYVYRQGLFQTFENFELYAEIKTSPEAVASILFHTNPRDLEKGYEIRIDNSAVGNWSKLLKTGSLSSIRNVNYNMVEDDVWFELRVRVVENHISISVNDLPVVDYIEPEVPYRTAEHEKRKLRSGTIAIQSLYSNTNLSIRKLTVEKLVAGDIQKNEDPEYARQITMLNIRNFPVADYHVHIKGDLTMDQCLDISSSIGVNYGIAANCGLKFPIQTDEELEAYLNSIEGQAIFKAMQAEGREWVDMFDPSLIARFDYAFTDAMTWTNDRGTRMRLWIPEETDVGDPEDFMDQLVAQIEKIVTEPIAIYVNPTYLPEEIDDRYEELWTDERIDRVVKALKDNGVALEINSRLQRPGKRFIQRAKEEGVKFAMGTNNTSAESLGRLEWALEMVHEFNLQSSDMFLPGVPQ